MKVYLFVTATLFVVTYAQKSQYTTPVPILKQINKHNEDGSYSYGYEGADGTFKIETKYADGEVYGKYGYVDDTGKLREVEYGASKRGFEPNGNDIQVPPPTLRQDQNAIARPLAPNEVDDGQYREDPSVYYQDEERSKGSYQQPQSIYRPQSAAKSQQQADFSFNWDQPQFTPQYQKQPQYQEPRQYQQPRPYQQPRQYQQPSQYQQPRQYQQPAPQYYQPQQPQQSWRPQSYYNPQSAQARSGWNQFQGHPASNVDIWTGSYSVNYKR